MSKYFLLIPSLLFCLISCQKYQKNQLPSHKSKEFLLSSQNKDGSWDPNLYGGNFAHSDGKLAVTALAAAALLEYKDKRSKEACQNSLQFLMNLQNEDGSIGERNYANGISFYLFAKSLSVGHHINKNSFQRLFKNIITKQSATGAWDYTDANDDRNDMSISAWVCLGLNILITQNEYEKEAKNSLIKINKMLNRDKNGAGDDSNLTKAIGAYTYGEDPNSPAGKVLRSPGTTIQAIILFIKSTILDYRQSNWVEIAKKDQIKALTGKENLSLYQTFFLLQSKKNGVKFDSEWLLIMQKSIEKEQLTDGSWPLTSPPIQFGGKIMVTAMGLIILQGL